MSFNCGTCKECKFWKRFEDDVYTGIRSEEFRKAVIHFGECNHEEKFVYGYLVDDPTISHDSFIYATSSGLCGAEFETGENFGCIHFQKKEGN